MKSTKNKQLRQANISPAQCLRAEVNRFKATNCFTAMDVTGFYIQAAVVLDEHDRMVEALKEIRDTNWNSVNWGRIAARALPTSEQPKTPNTAATLELVQAQSKDAHCLECRFKMKGGADIGLCPNCGSFRWYKTTL